MKIFFMAVLVVAVPLVFHGGGAWAAIQYLGDGAVQNSRNGWDLPLQGTCPVDLAQTTRPGCLSLRLNVVQASCSSPTMSWTTTGVCNDLVNTNQVACEAAGDRLWNAGTGVCAVVMMYDDRNDVTCARHGGTWDTTPTCVGVWVMPARTAYTPPLLTSTNPGDICLRCHNARTQYNSPRVRDTEDTLYMGHKNMARKVTVGTPWGGPPFACSNPLYTTEEDCFNNGGTWDPEESYPSDDSGNLFNWTNGTINVGGFDRNLTWIYGDWLSPLPRAIYKAPAATTQTCSDPRYTNATCVANGGVLLFNAGATYSCGRCHMTGWTSDAAIVSTKEPELSFPGITWDRINNATADVVNLSGAVSGDPNKYSSWDVWGISCARCHNSAIESTSGTGSPPQYSAPTGMSSHHNNLTAADISSGMCSDTRWTAEAQCTANGGVWSTACSVNPTGAVCTTSAVTQAACTSPAVWVSAPGWCSNAYYSTSGTCTANGFVWQDGWCTRPDLIQSTCTGGGLTWRLNGTMASCMVAGATWSFGSCSVEGLCNKGTCSNPADTNQVNCEDHGGTWTGISSPTACVAAGGQFRYATDIIRCEDADGHWTGNNTGRGPVITALCMNCHRQETGGLPYGATSADGVNINYTGTDPAGQVKVGPYHSTVTFLSHPAGNQFLNSPHGKFEGTYDKIATGKFKFDMTGEYKSFFQTESETGNTGNGCTGCHEVHNSTVAGENPFRAECTECHQKNLGLILHPSGGGTPLEDMADDPIEPCILCHMPDGMHLWRVNSDAAYSTFPVAGAMAATSGACTAAGGTWTGTACTLNANTSPDGTYTNAVWVDLDYACGTCHGGGSAQAATTGTIATGTKVVSVASTTGFVVGEKIRITDAGSFEYEDSGPLRGDFDTYIASIGTNSITVAGNAPIGVTGKAVVQNATKNGAGYMTKAELAGYANNIHNDMPYASFGTTLGSPNTLLVNVNASGSTCSGSSANCDAYDWDWGDGSAHGSGVTASHTYATGGSKAITLTVHEYGVNEASKTKNVTVYAPDYPPAVGGLCTPDLDTWTETVTDTSTDDNPPLKQVTVSWGDGSVLSSDTTSPFGPFTRTYLNAGGYTITHKAIDSIGQQSSMTCSVTFSYFTISGTVYGANGTTPVPGAIVTVKKGTTVVRTVSTTIAGTFLAGSLKPGTYSITVSKPGFTFNVPAIAAVTVGPSKSGNDITATAGVYVRKVIDSPPQ